MGDEISEHSITFCYDCFAGKMPASSILYRILLEERTLALLPKPHHFNQHYWEHKKCELTCHRSDSKYTGAAILKKNDND
jgi:hypothetical protein